jgi:hypothetical protein
MIEVAPKSFLGFGEPIFAVHLLNTQHLLNGNELSPPKHRNLYSLNMIIESNGRGSEAKLFVSETSPQNCSLHLGRSLRDEFRLREDVTASQKEGTYGRGRSRSSRDQELLQKSTSILLAKSGPTAASKELNPDVVREINVPQLEQSPALSSLSSLKNRFQ